MNDHSIGRDNTTCFLKKTGRFIALASIRLTAGAKLCFSPAILKYIVTFRYVNESISEFLDSQFDGEANERARPGLHGDILSY